MEYSAFYNFIVFLGYIVYNYLAGSLFDKGDKYWYFISAAILFIVSCALLLIKNGTKVALLFMLFLAIGYASTAFNMYYLKSASDTTIENYQMKTKISTTLFLMCGLFAYILNYYESNDCYSNELLCNKSILMIFLIANISIYQMVHFSRQHIKKIYSINASNTENSDTGLSIIGLICLWQFYIYFLSDGFTDGRMISSIKQMGSGNPKTMYEIFSGLSIIVITGFIINNIYMSSQCVKWKNDETINNSKEITYNMVCTTISTIIILTLLGH
jgi:hypothetical protein